MIALPADLNDLARYAIGRPWWEWAEGMLARWCWDNWTRVIAVSDDGAVMWEEGEPDLDDPNLERAVPDFTDGATLGALEALAAQVIGPDRAVLPYATYIADGSGDGVNNLPCALWWRLEAIGVDACCALTRLPVRHPDSPRHYIGGPTRIHALVAALDALHGRPS